ncbi:hypothetical protein [Paraburkholderia saeva]|uniref:Uncharacterized protein n=1 Tax=Paraburkholderia saeva TaxID=2777537 RepID=A0A9N8S2L4_9BURK|nr:hypothetical protein [Paraburkholderia saeva]CAG4928493.1 hypothetical protein LMG31841_05828 [Paraburkholderia saeva]CAG4928712.1 hypothetical protein R70241_05768 [Paraburkholderia saeva]CAG4928791.1 hypothetical protein R52603_05745 [Paraburkholderia saeva]
MKHYITIFVVGFLAVACFSGDALADDGMMRLGVGTSTLMADGPKSVQVRMGDCQFSMTLKKGEHIKYNDPDLILYRANAPLPDRELPFLQQAQTYSGYDWWFEKRGTVNVPWIGFMCENTSDFKWSLDNAQTDISQEMQDITDANSLRCPADFDGKQWTPLRKTGGANFENIDVPGANGFVVDIKSKKNGIQGPRFCFVNGKNVLIGVSGGGANTQGEKNSKDGFLLPLLRSIKF